MVSKQPHPSKWRQSASHEKERRPPSSQPFVRTGGGEGGGALEPAVSQIGVASTFCGHSAQIGIWFCGD